jgi:hypothetical protein
VLGSFEGADFNYLFPSLSKMKGPPTLLNPLERANLNPGTDVSFF